MITYRTDLAGVNVGDLDGFFDGWPASPTPAALLRVLTNSTHVVLAVEDGKVIGLINALSDGEFAAYIPLLEVRATHRGAGIGSELVRRLLSMLGDVYMADPICDEAVAPFYERLGLMRLTGMALRNRAASVLSAER
ncbi:MAG: GNAT family N-acetyltransferase [Acidothermaceae bacterium]